MKTENKPFAPFGALFHQLTTEKIKLRNSVFFFCGKLAYTEAVNTIQNGNFALCLPYGKNIQDFRWAIKGLKLILYDTGGMASLGLSKMAFELLKQEAEIVCVFSEMKGAVDIHLLKKDLINVRHKPNQHSGRAR